MRYIDAIQSSLDYIEQNLKAELTAAELSERAGFSVYHFYRLFRDATGLPVMQYVTRRRLLWATYEISLGRKIVDAALDYGFDTAAGFYKAFRREFGCSPSSYAKRFRARTPYRIDLLREEHIMISEKKLRSVLTRWNLSHLPAKNILYDTGEINENVFAVGDDYHLKVLTNLGTVEKNIAVARALAEAGLGSALPVETADGAEYAADGELYFLLTRRIDGEPLPASAYLADGGIEKARYLGKLLAELHAVLAQRSDVVLNERNIFDEVLESWLEPSKKAMKLDEKFVADYVEAVARLNGTLPEQVIHRDPNPSNILFKDGKLAGFLDFDLSQRSIRLFDPCYAATAVLVETVDTADAASLERWTEVYRAILDGYASVAQLTDAEREAAPYVVLSIQFICVGYFSGIEKFSDLARSNIAMTEWLIERFDRLKLE